MTISVIILFSIIIVATILFVTEIFSVDKTAFLVLVTLLLTGLVTPEESISGFSNPAVLTIMCLMILSVALEYNGSIQLLGQALVPIVKLPLLMAVPLIMLSVGLISAFISTTAVVILFVKIMPPLSEKYGIKLSNFMMPITFAGILGGSCTLMGTSTNLLVNQIAVKRGLAPLTFFQFSSLGFMLLAIGILIVTILVLSYLNRVNHENIEPDMKNDMMFYTTVELLATSNLVGQQYKDSSLYANSEITLLNIKRGEKTIKYPAFWQKFRAGDKLIIRSTVEKILELKENSNLEVAGEKFYDMEESKFKDHQGKIIKILILPNSSLLGKSFDRLTGYDLNGAMPLALQKHKSILQRSNQLIKERYSRVRLDVGDKLLVEVDNTLSDNWSLDDEVEIINDIAIPERKGEKKWLSLIVLALIVGLAASGIFSILKASLVGVGLLLITRSISLEKAYRSINWQVIFLLAGLLPLGIAMENSGADSFLGEFILDSLDGYAAPVVLSILFFITMSMSSVISNNATAIIIAPIAISVAIGIDANPLPFLLVTALGANFSFFTPIGYQTNTIVYGMGIYKFKDFLIVGGILSLALLIISSLLIPLLFTM